MIGEILREYRKRHNLTQSELARRIGITREALAKWETEKAAPTFKTLLKIFQEIPPCEVFSPLKHNFSGQQSDRTTRYCVYPKIIVFCPKEKREKRGQECLNCEHFSGLKTCPQKGLIWIECDFKG